MGDENYKQNIRTLMIQGFVIVANNFGQYYVHDNDGQLIYQSKNYYNRIHPHFEKNFVFEINLPSQELREISLDHPNKLTNKWTVQKIEAISNICGDTNTIVVIFEGGKFGILNLTTSEFEELKEKSKDFQDNEERKKKGRYWKY